MKCFMHECGEDIDPDEVLNHLVIKHKIYSRTKGTTFLFRMIFTRLEELEKELDKVNRNKELCVS